MTPRIELRHLRYFLAVAEELSFRRAAERLHLAQPPLSRQIQQLEAELGAPLFHRSKSGVALTEAGAAFMSEARQILNAVEKAVAVARSRHAEKSAQLAVGYTTVFDRSAIPDVFEPFRRRFPECKLTVKGAPSVTLIREIKKGAMDAAFIGLHTDAKGLTVETIRKEPVIAALPARHRLAKKRSLRLDDLRDEPIFWFERRANPGFYDYCAAFFARRGFEPRTIPEPDDHHILLGLIAEGAGLALLPASLSKVRRAGVVFRKFAEAEWLSMGAALAYSEENRSPHLALFLELARKVIGRPTQPA